MGRANVAVLDEEIKGDAVFLYSHSLGAQLPGRVQKALARRRRWGDSSYLACIVLDAMRSGASPALAEVRQRRGSGFGISCRLHDHGEHPVIVLDCGSQAIYAVSDEEAEAGLLAPVAEGCLARMGSGLGLKSLPGPVAFEEFVTWDDPNLIWRETR